MPVLQSGTMELGWLVRLGSRAYIVGEITSAVLLAKSCEQPAPPPCETCGTGGSDTSASSSGGSGGDETTGTGAVGGGGDATGGSGGTGAAGGTGGAGGSTVSSGGTGGSGGCPVYECGAKDCGIVDNGCEAVADCDQTETGAVTCASQNAGQDMGGPMTCGADHLCHCPLEGGSVEAVAKCAEPNPDNPGIDEWCALQGGCDPAHCGTPPVPKVSDSCKYGGELNGKSLWCCAKRP